YFSIITNFTGGTLTKIAYYSTVSQRIVNYEAEESGGDEDKFDTLEGSRLHFVKFETKYIASCLDFVRQNLVASRELMTGKKIKATGGGAYRYADLLHEKLGLSADLLRQDMAMLRLTVTSMWAMLKFLELSYRKPLPILRQRSKSSGLVDNVIAESRRPFSWFVALLVDKEDEMACLIKGCNFLLKNISDEAFIYHRHGDPEYEFQLADPNIFPYLLVNIGSGVSIMKVESEDKYERIGGTATGGGTFWGLGSLLTKAKGFDELLELAEKGDHRHADMLVRDIYGGDYQTLGLPGDLIASSFGKVCPKRGNGKFINLGNLSRS
ncbi:Pantothenate kinase 4, partial [Homalodisca vitripennis]